MLPDFIKLFINITFASRPIVKTGKMSCEQITKLKH